MTTAMRYAVKSEIYHVPMRDGVKLSVHVHRPEAEGTFPAIVEYTPYRKGPLGPCYGIVERGYATVVFDIRGTGNSEGWNDSIYCAATRQDGYDMVEWAAAQPWCSGSVGMWGISFGAVVTLQTAMMAPPHLKAVIVRSGTDDPYTEWTNPGGSPRPYIYQVYAPIMTAANFSPPDPAEVGDRWQAIWQERLERNVPWGIAFLEHLEDGPFWRERALRGQYDRVRCAVFVVDGWADWYPTPLLRTFAALQAPKRALIGPWSHRWPDNALPGPQIDWTRESARWFDYWLKGIDTGVMDEPPVTLFVREFCPPETLLIEDRGVFRSEDSWPIARVADTPLFFAPDGRLDPAPPAEAGCDRFAFDPRAGMATGMHGGGPFSTNWLMPLDQRADDATALAFTTAPLPDDLEVSGTPRLRLHFSSSTDTGLLFARLCDVAPDGASALVTKGYLHAAHRDSHRDPTPLEPGRVYPLEIEMLACAYTFRAGHRLRVSLAGGDLCNLWPIEKPGEGRLHRGADAASGIVLPVIPPRAEPLPLPRLVLNPVPLPDRESLVPPGSCSLTREPIEGTAGVELTAAFAPHWTGSAHYRVSAATPAEMTVQAESTCDYAYAGQEIRVHARCETSSDRRQYRHVVDLTVTIDGAAFAEKHWETAVPRRPELA